MRLIPRVALVLTFACAGLVLPSTGASALPLGWPPCAYPQQDDTTNYGLFNLQQQGGKVAGGAVATGAEFLATCPGATYDFTFQSAVLDRKGSLLGLGWSLGDSSAGAQELPATTETVRTVRFTGDGLGHRWFVAGTTSEDYYNKKLPLNDHCVEISLTVTVEGQVYELPREGVFTACSGQDGATSSFK